MTFEIITAGNVAVLASVGGAAKWIVSAINKLTRKLDVFTVEHEMLLSDYCRQHHIKVSELPTRSRESK